MNRSALRLFRPNIDGRGRWWRALMGLLLLAGAGAAYRLPALAVGLALSGGFVLFEAWRGWCVLRACGIKTRL